MARPNNLSIDENRGVRNSTSETFSVLKSTRSQRYKTVLLLGELRGSYEGTSSSSRKLLSGQNEPSVFSVCPFRQTIFGVNPRADEGEFRLTDRERMTAHGT